MKKVLPVLALVGGVAALVAYKLKKDEQKKMKVLDEELLVDDYNQEEEDKEHICDCVNECECNNVDEQEDKEVQTVDWFDYAKRTTELISECEANGLVLSQERPIEHSIEFLNEEDATNFKNIVVNRGYVVSKSDKEYVLQVLHICPLLEEKLLKHVSYLVNTAQECHGTYLGWDTK